MRRQQGRVSRKGAVTFLLFEDRFPRSLRYCLRSAIMLARRRRSQIKRAAPPRPSPA